MSRDSLTILRVGCLFGIIPLTPAAFSKKEYIEPPEYHP
jgi:hypothetical protein